MTADNWKIRNKQKSIVWRKRRHKKKLMRKMECSNDLFICEYERFSYSCLRFEWTDNSKYFESIEMQTCYNDLPHYHIAFSLCSLISHISFSIITQFWFIYIMFNFMIIRIRSVRMFEYILTVRIFVRIFIKESLIIRVLFTSIRMEE